MTLTIALLILNAVVWSAVVAMLVRDAERKGRKE